MTSDSSAAGQAHEPHLTPWDGISIIVGIVVGVSIFKAPPDIFSNVQGPWQMIGAWSLGGVLSLAGALCYAELATTYPYVGGDYAYLRRAFGGWFAFLFGWSQLAATLTGSIGTMAYVFADYTIAFLGWSKASPRVGWAVGAVLGLAIANVLGARVGKTLQNILTITKLLGLTAIVGAAFFVGGDGAWTPTQPMGGLGFGLAMIFVLYAYGGWNDAAFVAAEVRQRERNIPRVLVLGIGLILLIYLVVNVAYLWGLGFDGVRGSEAPAADILDRAVGRWGARAVSALVIVSALGAINGLLFTGSRVYTSMGHDHRVFAFLKRWDPRLNTPIWSLAASASVAVLMIVLVGTESGRAWIDQAFVACHLSAPDWARFRGGFETLVAVTAPVFWGFFLLTGLALFVLRQRDPHTHRPFRVPLYPLTPSLFCLTSVYMLHQSLAYAGELALLGLLPLAVGIPLFYLDREAYREAPPSRD